MKRTAGWLDHQDVCLKLKISKRTLQTLRDNGTLAYTKIGNRTYYLPEDVERIVTKVEDRLVAVLVAVLFIQNPPVNEKCPVTVHHRAVSV